MRQARCALGAALVVVLVAGCSGAGDATDAATATAAAPWPSSEPLTVHGMDLRPQLDESTGAVILPLDRFEPTDAEVDLLTSAASVAIALCARERGVAFVGVTPPSDPRPVSEQFYGPWTVAQAERFAFVPPMSDADLAANGLVDGAADTADAGRAPHPNTLLTDEDWAVVEACDGSGVEDEFHEATRTTGPWSDGIEAAAAALMRQDETAALLDELGACFGSRGMQQDPDLPWAVVGAGRTIDEQQVRLALGVVSCKEQVDFTPRMADLYARATLPVIAAYADELVERRRALDETLAAAQDLVAAHADVTYDAWR